MTARRRIAAALPILAAAVLLTGCFSPPQIGSPTPPCGAFDPRLCSVQPPPPGPPVVAIEQVTLSQTGKMPSGALPWTTSDVVFWGDLSLILTNHGVYETNLELESNCTDQSPYTFTYVTSTDTYAVSFDSCSDGELAEELTELANDWVAMLE